MNLLLPQMCPSRHRLELPALAMPLCPKQQVRTKQDVLYSDPSIAVHTREEETRHTNAYLCHKKSSLVEWPGLYLLTYPNSLELPVPYRV